MFFFFFCYFVLFMFVCAVCVVKLLITQHITNKGIKNLFKIRKILQMFQIVKINDYFWFGVIYFIDNWKFRDYTHTIKKNNKTYYNWIYLRNDIWLWFNFTALLGFRNHPSPSPSPTKLQGHLPTFTLNRLWI